MTINKILQDITHAHLATNAGTSMHHKLQQITITPESCSGAPELITRIKNNPLLSQIFSPDSQTEIPIAGTINGHFISRRIDRLLINNTNNTIIILDYKTDTNRNTNHQKYTHQINEYIQLLHAIYPNHKITGYILWTHDFSLEKLPPKQL